MINHATRWFQDLAQNIRSFFVGYQPYKPDPDTLLPPHDSWTGSSKRYAMEDMAAWLVKMNEALPSMHDLMPPRHQGMIIEVEGYQVEI